MASSLYNQMSQQNSNGQIQQIKQMASMLKNSNNPMQLLQTAAQNNSQVSQVMNMINGSGMTAKDMFNNLAKQKGIDPNQIVNMLK